MKAFLHGLAAVLAWVSCLAAAAQSLPEGFNHENISTDFDLPTGMLHTHVGISYVWELDGRVWVFENGEKATEPLLDLSEEVARWWDHGLLSVALHPDFLINGYIYLLYVVERNHLLNYGSPDYNPALTIPNTATMGRLTRFTVSISDYKTMVEGSRMVLIGDSIHNGFPMLTISHGLGTILFGKDKTMLVSMGDSNAPGSDYNGQGEVPALAFEPQALMDGIIGEDENIGGFRSQFLNSYCGKIIRIDPETGLGIPGNPWYNAQRPDQPISKVWALGLRNPFRMAIQPFTGSTNPADANPGVILVGDVGDWSWEEINVVEAGGKNFGWPLFQGPESYYLWQPQHTPNSLAPNPLFNEVNCPEPYFYYHELIAQPRADHSTFFPNPCNPALNVPGSAPAFVHARPALSYHNPLYPEPWYAAVPSFNEEGEASWISIADEAAGVEGGENFTGFSVTGGVFYEGAAFPEPYASSYFFGDFSGWMRVVTFNEEQGVARIETFAEDIGGIVHLSVNPADECLYYTTLFPSGIHRICFGGNLKPVIQVTPEVVYGFTPLEVTFDASASYDPEGTALTFYWDFGDGTTAEGPVVTHTYLSQGQELEVLEALLTVEDEDGGIAERNIPVSLNNTPPQVAITSLYDGMLYSMEQVTQHLLQATVSDAEHAANELQYQWRTFLHHNTHFHLESTALTPESSMQTAPLGCGIESFWYRVQLEVTDPGNLTTRAEVLLMPDCEGLLNIVFADERGILLFPNPANDLVSIKLDPEIYGNACWFRVFDTNGRLHYERRHWINGSNDFQSFATDHLAAGLYLLHVTGQEAQSTVRFQVIR